MKQKHKETLEKLLNEYGAEEVLETFQEIADRINGEATLMRDELFESLRKSVEIGNLRMALEKMDRLRRLI
jgi:hypothetical protein